MKKYIKICILIAVVEVAILIAANIMYVINNQASDDRIYRVSAKRIEDRIKAGTKYSDIDIDEYENITGIGKYEAGVSIAEDYLILIGPDQEIYYVTYNMRTITNSVLIWLNAVSLIVIFVSLIAFIYIGNTVIKPFNRIRELPYELSKGNLTVPVKEEKNKIFGRFLWGMDLLRENLEDSKEEELRLQKEKKTLLLSISHDIKTPLSSIKLYSKALKESLYDDEAKKQEVYQGIENNANDIENYVNQIIKASKEDFLNLKVENGSFYLSDAIDRINELYSDKLAPLKTAWSIAKYDNCILSGDLERLIEVLQNIMENAIKYGDGESIRLSVDEEEDCKLVRIESSGEPIKAEELPHLFDSFYRGSNVGNKKGSGLGLYICRTLMQLMDGDIYAESLDNGNAFTVVIRKMVR